MDSRWTDLHRNDDDRRECDVFLQCRMDAVGHHLQRDYCQPGGGQLQLPRELGALRLDLHASRQCQLFLPKWLDAERHQLHAEFDLCDQHPELSVGRNDQQSQLHLPHRVLVAPGLGYLEAVLRFVGLRQHCQRYQLYADIKPDLGPDLRECAEF